MKDNAMTREVEDARAEVQALLEELADLRELVDQHIAAYHPELATA